LTGILFSVSGLLSHRGISVLLRYSGTKRDTMRNRFLLLPLLALQLSANAQSYSIPQANFSKHTIQALNKGNAQNKTSGAQEHLSAIATYSIAFGGGLPSMELQDSTYFKYSNGRGSTFIPGEVNAFNLTEYAMFDSSWKYGNNGSGMALNEMSASTYTSSNKRVSLTSFMDNGSAGLIGKQDVRYEYNTAGNVTVKHDLEWNSSASKWDSVTRTYYDYNTQNKLQTTTIYNTGKSAWELKTTNHYNATGDIDTVLIEYYTTGWAPTSREIHSFSTGNKLTKNIVQNFDSASLSWKDQRIDSFGYTTGADFFTYMEVKEWDTATAAWLNSSLQIRTLNAQKLVDVETFKSWDTAAHAWDTQVEMEWVYNTNNNPIRMDITSPMFPLPMPVSQVFMYYDTTINTSVSNMSKSVQLTMYPNPATDKLNIDLGKDASGDAMIAITNMAGQVVSYSKRTNVNGIVEVSLQGFQPGSYSVTVNFADGSRGSQRIIKQ
jgi:hypothetical protein